MQVLYQTKVDESLHRDLQNISSELIKYGFIDKASKYEVTKFALTTVRDMFRERLVNDSENKRKIYEMLKNSELPLLKED